jgi:hypothetical protein
MNKLQHLGYNDAVEGLGGQMMGGRQVTDEGRLRVAFFDIKHIAFDRAISAEEPCIRIVMNFKHATNYLVGMTLKEVLM